MASALETSPYPRRELRVARRARRQDALPIATSKITPMRFNMVIDAPFFANKAGNSSKSGTSPGLSSFAPSGIAKLKPSDATSSPVFQSRTSMVYCGDIFGCGDSINNGND